jgi:hypothetical protein
MGPPSRVGREVSMADVYAVFGTLLALGIAFPGLLTGSWLLFPGVVGRAQTRVSITPLRSLFLGIGGIVALAIPVALLNAMPFGVAKLLAVLLVFGGFGMATLGAAAIAVEMGERLQRVASPTMTRFGAVVRGALALGLAAVFPIVGWFLVIPGVLLIGFGAGIFGVLRWMPRPRLQTHAEPVVAGA